MTREAGKLPWNTDCRRREPGAALVIVLIVLTSLALIGAPFAASMLLEERASRIFAGGIAARAGALAARNHALAQLERTARPAEFERELARLEELEEEGRRRRIQGRGRGRLEPRERESGRRLERGRRGDGGEAEAALPAHAADTPEELQPAPLGEVEWEETPASRRGGEARLGEAKVSFHDPRGITASAHIEDEQGKIHLDTAPPALLGNLFGVSRLADPLPPGGRRLILEDASPFAGDGDAATVDGALVLQPPGESAFEIVTYRRKRDNVLEGLGRGAFFSREYGGTFPAGTFAYDLRGWKAAHHRFWSPERGDFSPDSPPAFRSVEALREIAAWPVAALVLDRYRNLRLEGDLLRKAGLDRGAVDRLGLRAVTSGDAEAAGSARALREARSLLRRKGVPNDLLRELERRRGARFLVELAAELREAHREDVKRRVAALREALRESSGATARGGLDRTAVAAAFKELEAVRATPGIETILRGDIERLRPFVTVASHCEGLWGEAQAVLNAPDAGRAGVELEVPRPVAFSPGTLVRIRSAKGGEPEINLVSAASQGLHGSIRLAFPLRRSYREREARVEARLRHPVNVNTAPEAVLAAVFAGVRGRSKDAAVTPEEAKRLARFVISSRPLRGYEALFSVFDRAARAGVIDREDVLPLTVNAVSPLNSALLVSTTGFVFASGDIYTVESRAVLRSAAGTAFARSQVRELIDLAPPGVLKTGLVSQFDMIEGIFLRDPAAGLAYPEGRYAQLLELAGRRAHLVASGPYFLDRSPLRFPPPRAGYLRLLPAESPDPPRGTSAGPVLHFRESMEGLELEHGEAYSLDIGVGGGDGAGRPGGAGGGDLLSVPGGVEFWFRLRSVPPARSEDGLVKLLSSAGDPDYGRLELLYDDGRGRLVARLSAGGPPDPSLPAPGRERPYDAVEVEVYRRLELHTWYHAGIHWSGVRAGGLRLWLDGFPAGEDGLATELLSAVPASGPATFQVRDASAFPLEGVVRIGGELIDYRRSGNTFVAKRALLPHPVPDRRSSGERRGRPREETPLLAAPLLRGETSPRGSRSSAHAPGARVELFGYSVRLLGPLEAGVRLEGARPPAPGADLVWGPGGLSTAEPLPAFSMPPGAAGIIHYVPRPPEEEGQDDRSGGGLPGGGRSGGGRAGNGRPGPGSGPGGESGGDSNAQEREEPTHLIPLFVLEGVEEGAPPRGRPRGEEGAPRALYSARIPGYPYGAADYFQSRGIVAVGGVEIEYRKEPLPGRLVAEERADPRIDVPQTIGLRIVGPYPPRAGAGRAAPEGEEADRGLGIPDRARLVQRSLLANGAAAGRYPPSGIVEVRGRPAPWQRQRGRPDFYGGSLFARHPDDTVEWIRYDALYGDLFVAYGGGFRGALSSSEFDIPQGEALRLVAEVSGPGPGSGDYVALWSRSPVRFEPTVRRIYKVVTSGGGTVHFSLVPVDGSGRELANLALPYRYAYRASDDPYFVKFPGGGLPLTGSGTLTFFGQAGAPVGGGRSRTRRRPRVLERSLEEDEARGTVLDEIVRLRDPGADFDQGLGARSRYYLVPLEGGRAPVPRIGLPGAVLGRGVPVTPSRPFEVIIVSRREGGGPPPLFGRDRSSGVLRAGNELFYFEIPEAERRAESGRAVIAEEIIEVRDGRLVRRRRRAPPRRPRGPGEHIEVTRVERPFPPQGFAKLVTSGFGGRSEVHEIFFYDRFGGESFENVRRGLFLTPVRGGARQAMIYQASRRILLKGRALLGTEAAAHAPGEEVELVPYPRISRLTGPLNAAVVEVEDARLFSLRGGYVYVDGGFMGWGGPREIIAYLGRRGRTGLVRALDEDGAVVFGARFGTPPLGAAREGFAYDLPFRHYDRFEAGVESESLAYFQRSFYEPGAYWRALEWREREWKKAREPLVDIVVACRFDGKPDWKDWPSEKSGSGDGGLLILEKGGRDRSRSARFELGRRADLLELRVYFRYRSGAFGRLDEKTPSDDWKETPVLESLIVEYERDRRVLRREELHE